MSAVPKAAKSSFFKSHVLPVFLIFLIPGFSAWFFAYAEQRMDQAIYKALESQIQEDRSATPEMREAFLSFHRAVPVSKIMASTDPELEPAQQMYATLATPYATFRWMKRIAWTCLLVVAGTFVIVGLSVALSLRSHSAQYQALRFGLPTLQFSAAIQVLGQAALLVALSYWVTVMISDSYFPKLVIIAALLAIGAVFALWKAIFAKVDMTNEVNGEIVSDADAPALWQRTREIAMKLHTAPPDQIIAGIEPSFFVTEFPVTLKGEVKQGRTLFVSLPMLKVMSTEEADAVLGHELAHFSGQDTYWSRKIAPLVSKFGSYMATLANGIGIVAALFMHFFWKLYSLSLGKLSRSREFRADKVGAEIVSRDAAKRALVKTSAYCDYRHETELGIVKSNQVDRDLDLSRKLEEGYPAFLTAFTASDKASTTHVPHPFDTHPTLENRLRELGFETRDALADPALRHAPADSWYHAIPTAPAIEERMWAGQQETLQEVQKHEIVWRVIPKTEEELALVQEHFPRTTFMHKDGSQALLEHDRIYVSSWPGPIFFKDISTTAVADALKGQLLTITHVEEGNAKPTKTKLYGAAYRSDRGDLLSLFGAYFSRHQQSRLWNES